MIEYIDYDYIVEEIDEIEYIDYDYIVEEIEEIVI